jgi:hypothetical protein
LALDANVLLVYVVTILTRYISDSSLLCYEHHDYKGHHVIGGMFIVTAGVAVSGLVVHGQFTFSAKPNNTKLVQHITMYSLALCFWAILNSLVQVVTGALLPPECEPLSQEVSSFLVKVSIQQSTDRDLIRFADLVLWVSWVTCNCMALSFSYKHLAQLRYERQRFPQLPAPHGEIVGSVTPSVLGMPVESCTEEPLKPAQDTPL